jgi:BlaI family penicillinase repressor
MKSFTKAEEQIMQAVWKLQSGLLMEIVDSIPAPQPHKNTVATILKTLVDKGYIEIENVGRIHRYHPLVTKGEYSKRSLTTIAKGYFEGSFSKVVSFLVDEKKISATDLELLLKEVKKKKNKQ